MSTSELHPATSLPDASRVLDLRLPLDRPRRGPLVTARLRRTALCYGLLLVLGVLPALTGAGEPATAFGLGLVLPGGGLLYTGAWIALAVTLVLFTVSLVAWFGSGMVIAPPIVWLGAAAYAAAGTGTVNRWAAVAVPLTAVLAAAGGSLAIRRAHAAARSRGEERNRYLATTTIPAPPADDGARELSPETLAHLRGLIDLGAQPLESFAGFDVIDQFQTSALRYQINFAHFALAMAQADATPAFRGYLRDTQARLISKMLVKRVWRYWQLENAWGNLSLDPEPIVRDNIMLSGYLGVMVNAFEATNRDFRFDEAGALTFRWDDSRAFIHDHHTIIEAIHQNFLDSPWGMFPCEPNWIYAACNTFGMNALLGHDAIHGSAFGADVMDRYLHALNVEFLTLDGRTTAIRSSRLGLTIPALTSTMADAGMALFNHSIEPTYSRRLWEIVRREFVRVGPEGHVDMALRGWDKLDVGNYRPSTITPLALVAICAGEMGDSETLEAINTTMAERYPAVERDGVRWWEQISTQANALHTIRQVSRRDLWRNLMLDELSGADGPILESVPYPDCLVARATSTADRLDAVLRAAVPGTGVTVTLSELRPGQPYELAVDGQAQTIQADHAGMAEATVQVQARSELTLTRMG